VHRKPKIRNFMRQQLVGTVYRKGSKNMPNHFVIAGPLPSDEEENYKSVRLDFRLMDPAEVEPLIELLPRQDFALLEWTEGQTTGLLIMVLKPRSRSSDEPAEANVGGPVRAIKVKDLLHVLSKDPSVSKFKKAAPMGPSSPRSRLRELPIPNQSREPGFSR
jgi:hypothetical protein